MKRLDIIDAIAKDTKLPKAQVAATLESMWNNITKTLKKGGEVQFTGLGKFEVVKRRARNGINPSTMAKMRLPSKRVVRFRTGARLDSAVN